MSVHAGDRSSLSETIKKLELVESVAGVGHWEYVLITGAVEWSDEVYKIHGANRSEFDPNIDAAVDAYHPDDRPLLLQCLSRAQSCGEGFELKLRIIRFSDQAERTVVVKGLARLGDDGQAKAIFGVFQDVTEEDNLKRRIAESEERLRALADTASDVLSTYGVDAIFSYVSPAIQTLLGYTPEEVIGKKTYDFIVEADHARLAKHFRRYMEGGASSGSDTIEYRARHKDGSILWMEAHPRAKLSATGQVVQFHDVTRDISQRKWLEAATEQAALRAETAQAEAAKNAALYRLLADQSMDVIVKIKLDGEILYCSPAIVHFGYRPEEVVGRNISDFVHPDDLVDRSRFAELYTRVGPKAQLSHEQRIRCKTGAYVWVEGNTTAVFDAYGQAISTIALLRDITERREAEQKLQASESKYRLLTENSSDLVTEMDRNGFFTYASPSVFHLTGYSAEEVVGVEAISFIHADDRHRVRSAFETALTGPAGWRIEYRLVCKSGSELWVEARPTLVRDPVTGKPTGVTDVIRDISARKATEEALAASEARYRLLADHASDMIAQCTLGGRITFISPSCRQILGYTAEEMVGTRTEAFTHPDDFPLVIAYHAALAERREGAGSETLQYRARRKDGRWVWLEGQPKVFFDAATGRPVSIQDAVRDVTRRKDLEIELQAALVAAEVATKVKSEFLSNMSHELRTPLTSIMGFSSLLKDEHTLSEQGSRSVSRVITASNSLLAIVNDVLDFSKLEAGQVEIDTRSVNLRNFLTDSLAMLEPQAAEKDLKLVFDASKLPDTVNLDDTRLRQVLSNLISNAIKFTRAGSVTLSSRYAGGRLCCDIIDTGDGIPPGGLDRLFQRFSQVDASTTRVHGGTGLGLAISKGLIEAMGGSIGVRSQVGVGSTFWFEVPCPGLALEQLRKEDIGTGPDLDGLRLLVVDDNSSNREIVRLMLSPLGVELTEAVDGHNAILLAASEPFDLILMDVRMAGIDGPTAAWAIRDGRGPNDTVPILAFTADATIAQAGKHSPFDDIVEKPIMLDNLLAVINRWNSGALDTPAGLILGDLSTGRRS